MRQEEIIRLDARVQSVIANAVFSAQLANGHEIVAFAAPPDRERAKGLQPGAVVRVEMSPFDMSKGRIVFGQEAEARDESQKFGQTNL